MRLCLWQRGMTATGIKAAKLKLSPCSRPPLAEQGRIEAQVEQLLSQCEQFCLRTECEIPRLRATLSAILHRLLDQLND